MINYIIKFPESLKKVSLKNSKIFFEGNLGIESVSYYPLSIKITDNKLEISKISLNNLFHARTIINLINQAIRGVDSGYKFQLKLIGLGYTCKLIDDKIEFKLGFSHLINKKIPSSLKVSCFNTKKRKQTIIVQGSNKQKVMEFVSLLQNLKYPEPYKGKGIFLKHQKIIRKQGKKV